MPDVTITADDTEKIINREQASLASSDESAVLNYIVHTDSAIKIIDGKNKEHARHGFPVDSGTTFTIDPRDHEIHAFADGSQATVSVQQMVFEVGSMG